MSNILSPLDPQLLGMSCMKQEGQKFKVILSLTSKIKNGHAISSGLMVLLQTTFVKTNNFPPKSFLGEKHLAWYEIIFAIQPPPPRL